MLRLAKLSLMARASLALAAVGLAPLGVMPFLVGMNRDAMQDQVLRLHAVAARSAAERVLATLQPWQSASAALARNPLVAADPRSGAAREALLAQVQAHPGVAGVAVTNAAGEEYIRVQVAAHAQAVALLLGEQRPSPLYARVGGRGYLRLEAPLEGRDGAVRLVAELSGLPEITRP